MNSESNKDSNMIQPITQEANLGPTYTTKGNDDSKADDQNTLPSPALSPGVNSSTRSAARPALSASPVRTQTVGRPSGVPRLNLEAIKNGNDRSASGDQPALKEQGDAPRASIPPQHEAKTSPKPEAARGIRGFANCFRRGASAAMRSSTARLGNLSDNLVFAFRGLPPKPGTANDLGLKTLCETTLPLPANVHCHRDENLDSCRAAASYANLESHIADVKTHRPPPSSGEARDDFLAKLRALNATLKESRDQAGKGHSQPQGNDDAKAASSTSTNLAAAGKAVIILTAARPLLRGCSPPGVVKAAAKCLLLATLYNTYKAAKVSSAKTFKKQGADWFCRLALHKLKRKPTPSRSVPSSPKHMALALAAQYVREREHGRPVAFAAAAAAVTGAAHLCRWWRPRCST